MAHLLQFVPSMIGLIRHWWGDCINRQETNSSKAGDSNAGRAGRSRRVASDISSDQISTS